MEERQFAFNRTYLELKLIGAYQLPATVVAFNRTYLELKRVVQQVGSAKIPLLIAPIWN